MWGPLIFVNLDLEAPPLEGTLQNMPAVAEEAGLDVADPVYTYWRKREYTLKCNWKLVVENSTECYHCSTVHPGFTDDFDAAAAIGTEEKSAPSFTLLVPRRYDVDYHRPYVRNYHVHWVWPNFAVQGQPPDYYYTYHAQPIDANTTHFVEEYFFAEGLEEQIKESEFDLMETAIQEDWRAVESVQRGLRSRKVPQGRILTEEEHVLAHIQSLYAEAMEGTS